MRQIKNSVGSFHFDLQCLSSIAIFLTCSRQWRLCSSTSSFTAKSWWHIIFKETFQSLCIFLKILQSINNPTLANIANAKHTSVTISILNLSHAQVQSTPNFPDAFNSLYVTLYMWVQCITHNSYRQHKVLKKNKINSVNYYWYFCFPPGSHISMLVHVTVTCEYYPLNTLTAILYLKMKLIANLKRLTTLNFISVPESSLSLYNLSSN